MYKVQNKKKIYKYKYNTLIKTRGLWDEAVPEPGGVSPGERLRAVRLAYQAVGDAAGQGTLHGAPSEVAEYPPVVLESLLSLLSLRRKKSSCLAAFWMV